MLEYEGYEVRLAERSRHALELITTTPIDLVVSDLDLLEMRGTQLLREIAQVSPYTASVLMTGSGVESANLPVGVWIMKTPFTRQDLISAIQASLAQSAQARSEPIE
jgi:DNA-binding NtrC family response regulator